MYLALDQNMILALEFRVNSQYIGPHFQGNLSQVDHFWFPMWGVGGGGIERHRKSFDMKLNSREQPNIHVYVMGEVASAGELVIIV